jgi:hypothetical protein
MKQLPTVLLDAFRPFSRTKHFHSIVSALLHGKGAGIVWRSGFPE